jgi:hypothetical protein
MHPDRVLNELCRPAERAAWPGGHTIFGTLPFRYG